MPGKITAISDDEVWEFPDYAPVPPSLLSLLLSTALTTSDWLNHRWYVPSYVHCHKGSLNHESLTKVDLTGIILATVIGVPAWETLNTSDERIRQDWRRVLNAVMVAQNGGFRFAVSLLGWGDHLWLDRLPTPASAAFRDWPTFGEYRKSMDGIVTQLMNEGL